MVPKELPPQQPKDEKVVEALRGLIQSKNRQESIAAGLPGALGAAIERSNRLMAEDLCREAGFMLPQSGNTKRFFREHTGDSGYSEGDCGPALDTIHFDETV